MNLILPTPPTEEEKWLYRKSDGAIFYLLNSLSIVALLAGAWLFTLSSPSFYFYAVVGILSAAYLILSLIIGVFGKEFDFEAHKKIELDGNPTVDVFLPCCGEDIEIIKNTHKYVKELDWPGLQLRVYVLDDKGDPEVRDSALSHNFIYLRRPTNEHKKAGNLRYAFERSTGEYILVLDADFCPRPDFLKETIGYFQKDMLLSILQTAQYFRVLPGQQWVEKGAGYVQEVFYRLIQVKRDSFKAPICVGTNAVYRRKALEPFGGTALIDHSEDVHTGVNTMSLGYHVRYIPVNLACGICPDNASSFFNQQYRWAMGSISLFLKSDVFWKVKMTFMQRACYWTGVLYYLTTAISIFMYPLPAIALLSFRPDLIHFFNVFFTIPSLLFGTIYLAIWGKAKFGTYAIHVRHISSYAHLFAWVDGITGNKMQWVVSGDRTKNSKYKRFLTVLFFWNLIALTTSLVLVGSRIDVVGWNAAPIVFLSVFNMWAQLGGFFKD